MRSYTRTLAAALALLIASPLLAQTNWVGGTGAWTDGANWSNGVPGIFDDANIDNGGTAQITANFADANFLTLGSTAGSSGNLEISGGELFPERLRIGEVGTGMATVSGGRVDVGSSSLFVGGQESGGSGTLRITGPTAEILSGDDVQLGRIGNGVLEMSDGRMEGVFTVVGKFGSGTWNQSGGLFVARQDMEIGDGGRPDQSGTPGPRTGEINLSGGVIQADDFAIGNRVGSGQVNVTGTGYLAVTEPGGNNLWVGRGSDWAGNPGAGGATELKVSGPDAIVVVGADLLMNLDQVASSSTIVAEISGATHTPIKVAGNADITNGGFRVELDGYVPSSGDSWTILQAGADILPELTTIDNFIANNGYAPVTHDTPVSPGALIGTFMAEDLSAALPNGLSWALDYSGNQVTLSVEGVALPGCDFDNSGDCTIDDIDSLVMEIVAGGNGAIFDLNGDGMVDAGDVNEWLSIAGEENLGPGRAYLSGDSDLDGVVDGQDFITWNANKFNSTGKWSLADFNADGATDGQDFIIWNGNKFQSADAVAVPEPTSAAACIWCLAVAALLRKTKRS